MVIRYRAQRDGPPPPLQLQGLAIRERAPGDGLPRPPEVQGPAIRNRAPGDGPLGLLARATG